MSGTLCLSLIGSTLCSHMRRLRKRQKSKSSMCRGFKDRAGLNHPSGGTEPLPLGLRPGLVCPFYPVT